MSDPRALGRALRAAREARGWTIRELAKRAGIAPMTVLRVERGEERVRVGSLRGIATAFEIDESLLVRAVRGREDLTDLVVAALERDQNSTGPQGGRRRVLDDAALERIELEVAGWAPLTAAQRDLVRRCLAPAATAIVRAVREAETDP